MNIDAYLAGVENAAYLQKKADLEKAAIGIPGGVTNTLKGMGGTWRRMFGETLSNAGNLMGVPSTNEVAHMAAGRMPTSWAKRLMDAGQKHIDAGDLAHTTARENAGMLGNAALTANHLAAGFGQNLLVPMGLINAPLFSDKLTTAWTLGSGLNRYGADVRKQQEARQQPAAPSAFAAPATPAAYSSSKFYDDLKGVLGIDKLKGLLPRAGTSAYTPPSSSSGDSSYSQFDPTGKYPQSDIGDVMLSQLAKKPATTP